MASESLIVLDRVVKRFPGAFVLGPITLDVKQGELVAVLGPSGCGKTTLLRLIAGFERPDEGSIVIEGRIVAGRSQWVEPEDRQVGMVFQDYALFPHLTVAQNVSFGQTSSGLYAFASHWLAKMKVKRSLSRRSLVRELLQLVGLAGFEDRYPHELSGGEQQRVALARALAANPRVLLLDEPFSNLDADLRPKMRAELKILLHRLNCTTIFVTHDQEEAFELADRVAVLHAGRLEQIDTPERLYREPATRFVAEFIGHADFLTGRARGNCIETALGCFAKPPSVPEGAIVAVMVRPEEVELQASPGQASLDVHLASQWLARRTVQTKSGEGWGGPHRGAALSWRDASAHRSALIGGERAQPPAGGSALSAGQPSSRPRQERQSSDLLGRFKPPFALMSTRLQLRAAPASDRGSSSQPHSPRQA
jgi:iron(III) transport system ATP-binding protein